MYSTCPKSRRKLGDAIKVGLQLRFQLGAVVVSIRPSMAIDSAESFFSFLISMIFLLQKRLNFQCAAKGRAFHFL